MDLLKLKVMLELQDGLNNKINADWKIKKFPWHRAIWVECAELIDHYGWKWWKKSSPDIGQIRLELVDIWHFGLSDILQNNSIDESALIILKNIENPRSFGDSKFVDLVEEFSGVVIREKRFPIANFFQLINCIGFSNDDLHNIYVSKNILNKFRQENGYKDGSYIKIWDGLEDNQVLEDVMKNADFSVPNYADLIYQELGKRYMQVRR